MAKATSGSTQALKHRPDHPYKKQPCPKDWQQLCAALNTWGAAWQNWGTQVWAEVDALEARVKLLESATCALEQHLYYNIPSNQGKICNAQGRIVTGGGPPPTGSTQPPKPPF
jgi:hypothetical protein